jgi:CRISPR/Cas system-associated exonuclease Cas4 (RecB family)
VPVRESRLYYCTTRGGFQEYSVPFSETAKRHGQTVLEIIDRAVESGNLPPAPREKACEWCDFRPVCGPYEERRTREFKQSLAELELLRELP